MGRGAAQRNGPALSAPGRGLRGRREARHHHHRYAATLFVPRAGERPRAALRHRRRTAGVHLGGRQRGFGETRVAGLDAAGGDAPAPSRSAAPHGGRPGKSARRARALSRLIALSHPRLERALDPPPGPPLPPHPPPPPPPPPPFPPL